MSASIIDTDTLAGRVKHLGELAQIFRHRHGTWRDLGQFLKREFRDASGPRSMGGTPSGLTPMPCRHNRGGRHHAYLTATGGSNPSASVFNHERYSRPCLSHGAYEKGKNGGLVVHDLCIRAAAFLRDIGRGDPGASTRRDFNYDPSSGPASSSPIPPGSSQVSESSLSDVDMSSDVAPASAQAGRTATGRLESDDEFDAGGFFEDEDVRQVLGLDTVPWTGASSSVSLSDIPASQDSFGQSSGRGSSTKMRAATLAYLWQFADDPAALKREFRRLRADASLCVLHLCGCGLSYQAAGGRKVVGCAERSHLKLGRREENDNHRTYHQMFELGRPENYPTTVGIIHSSRDGDGVF